MYQQSRLDVIKAAAEKELAVSSKTTANKNRKEKFIMKQPMYKNYEELPLFLNADTVAKALGIAISSAYELMQEKDFPTFKVGNRKFVEKEKFRQWIEAQSGGNR